MNWNSSEQLVSIIYTRISKTIYRKTGSCWNASWNFMYLIPIQVCLCRVITLYVLMVCWLHSCVVAKNRGFCASDSNNCDLLGYNAVYFNRWYWTCWGNLLHPSSSTHNIQAAGSSKTFVTMDKTVWCHNHRRQQS